MKHTKVLKINVTAEELKDIRAAYKKMIAGLDINRMIAAMEALTPNRKTVLSSALLHQKLEKCYKDILEAWGPVNEDGSIDIDLLDYPSAGCGTMGFLLELKFDREKDHWIWTLNLEVASNYVYPVLVYDTEFINGRADAAAAEFKTRRLDGMTVNQAQECAIKVLTRGL